LSSALAAVLVSLQAVSYNINVRTFNLEIRHDIELHKYYFALSVTWVKRLTIKNERMHFWQPGSGMALDSFVLFTYKFVLQ